MPSPEEIKLSKESIEKFYDETFNDLLDEIETNNAEAEKVSETETSASEQILEMPFDEFDVVKEEEVEYVEEDKAVSQENRVSVEKSKPLKKAKVTKPKKMFKKLECVGCELKFENSLELWAHLHAKHFKWPATTFFCYSTT